MTSLKLVVNGMICQRMVWTVPCSKAAMVYCKRSKCTAYSAIPSKQKINRQADGQDTESFWRGGMLWGSFPAPFSLAVFVRNVNCAGFECATTPHGVHMLNHYEAGPKVKEANQPQNIEEKIDSWEAILEIDLLQDLCTSPLLCCPYYYGGHKTLSDHLLQSRHSVYSKSTQFNYNS